APAFIRASRAETLPISEGGRDLQRLTPLARSGMIARSTGLSTRPTVGRWAITNPCALTSAVETTVVLAVEASPMSGGLRSGNLEPQGQAPGLNGSGSFRSREPRTLVRAMFTHSDRGGVAKWPRRRSAKPLFSGSNPLAASTPTPLMRAGLPETPQHPAGCGQRPTGAVSATGSSALPVSLLPWLRRRRRHPA